MIWKNRHQGTKATWDKQKTISKTPGSNRKSTYGSFWGAGSIIFLNIGGVHYRFVFDIYIGLQFLKKVNNRQNTQYQWIHIHAQPQSSKAEKQMAK